MRGRLAKYARDLRTLPEDVRLALRLEGTARAWEEVLERTLRRVWRRRRFLLIEQPLAPLRERPAPAGIEIRQLGPTELERLAPVVSRRRLATYGRGFARGRACHAAFRDGRIVGYVWHSPRAEKDLEGYALETPSDVGYLWFVYVRPEERSCGIGSALTNVAQLAARAAGCRATWRLVRPHSAPTFRMMARNAGDTQRLLGELVYRRLLRHERCELRQGPVRCAS